LLSQAYNAPVSDILKQRKIMQQTKLQGVSVGLSGGELKLGDKAPELSLVTADLSEVKVGGGTGKAQVIVAVPSLDTDVCATETRKFNERAASIKNTEVFVISMDLPFAADRFCSTEGIKNLRALSDFRDKEFARAYGVLIADGALAGLTCRAVFVVDTAGKIAYKQITDDIVDEPDYDAALNAAAFASGSAATQG